jgi:hypothetical protein
MRLVRYAAAAAWLTMTAITASAAPAALASGQGGSDYPPAVTGNPNVNVTPNPSAPGTATTFVVNCNSLTAGGSVNGATLSAVALGLPSQIPMQPGAQPNQFVATVNLPQSIAPGSYSPVINCSNGITETVNININAVPGQAPATGDGTTATATDSRLTVAGLGLLGVAAVAGGLALRRRRPGGRHS